MSETETWIEEGLRARREAGLERQLTVYSRTGPRVVTNGRSLLNFSSNDYLGLARHPHVKKRAAELLETFGAGATASRLVVGSLDCHEELERRVAALKGYPASLVFASGYSANVGLMGAVVGRGDHVFMDRLAHASLLDAGVLSRARVHRFQHNDVEHLRKELDRCPPKGRRLVVTESVFSMDGDLAPLAEMARVAGAHGAMMLVDEAHATGVFGPGGAGLVREAGIEGTVNLSMGTLSKALGGQGGFVACSESMRAWVINRSRSFIYSTAPAPATLGAALGALDVLEWESGMGARLLARAGGLRERLTAAGLSIGASTSQIIPVMVGGNDRTLRIHRRLLADGLLAVPIRPPTVPPGTARLRLSVLAGHTDEELDEAVERIVKAVREEGGV